MATIRALWNSDGEPDSWHFPLRDAVFDLPRLQGHMAGDLSRRSPPAHFVDSVPRNDGLRI